MTTSTPEARITALTNTVVRTSLPWQLSALGAMVVALCTPVLWAPLFSAVMVLLVTVPLQGNLRRIEETGLDEELTGPLRRMVWYVAAGSYLFAGLILFVR